MWLKNLITSSRIYFYFLECKRERKKDGLNKKPEFCHIMLGRKPHLSLFLTNEELSS